MKIKKMLFIGIVAICMYSCKSPSPTGSIVFQNNREQNEETAAFLEGNRKIVQIEQENMCFFAKRYNWNMKNTGSGLLMEVLEKGYGKNAQSKDFVEIQYETFLLSGEKIYTSDSTGLLKFTVDKSDVCSAVHEAVKLLNINAKARILVPSYLGYGSVGDNNKIDKYTPFAMIIKRIK